jgi:hypothetical protein
MQNTKRLKALGLLSIFLFMFAMTPGIMVDLSVNEIANVEKKIEITPNDAVKFPGPIVTSLDPIDFDGSVTLEWQELAGMSTYYIYEAMSDLSSVDLDTLVPNATRPVYSIGLETYSLNFYTFNNLKNGQHWFAVVGYSAEGMFTTAGSIVNTTVMITFTAPVIDTLNATTPNNFFTINWAADPPGVINYQIYILKDTLVEPNLNAPNATVAATLPNTYTFTNLRNGTYFVSMRAEYPDGYSSLSAAMNFSVLMNFATPVLNAIQPNPSTTGNIFISWNLIPGAFGYYLYRSTTSLPGHNNQTVPLATLGQYQNTYNDISTSNITYYYQVVANYEVVNSTLSNEQNVTVRIDASLPPTQNPLATNLDAALIVSWNFVPGATGYSVYYKTGFDWIPNEDVSNLVPSRIITSGLTLTTTFENLPSANYSVVVTANFAGNVNSSISNIQNYEITQLEFSAPTLNPITPATSTTGIVAISWTTSPHADRYFVYWSRDPFTELTNTNNTIPNATVNDPMIASQITFVESGVYYCVVVAQMGVINSSKSNMQMVTVNLPAFGVPTLNQIVPNPSTTGNVILTWTLVAGADNYYLYRSTNVPIDTNTLNTAVPYQTFGPAVFTYQDTNLATDNVYYYVVVAYSAVYGNSSPSFVRSVLVQIPVFEAPTLAPITSPSTTGVINLNWNAIPNAQIYYVYRSPSLNIDINDPSITRFAVPGVTTYIDNVAALGNNTWYYGVTAWNVDNGQTSLSNVRSVQVVLTSFEFRTVTMNQITPTTSTTGQITLSWSAIIGTQFYYIYRSITNDFSNTEAMTPIQTLPFGVVTTLDVVLTNGTYYYAMKAGNGAVNTTVSNVVSVTVAITEYTDLTISLSLTPPDPADTGIVTLNWNNPFYTTVRFYVYRSTSPITDPLALGVQEINTQGPIMTWAFQETVNATYYYRVVGENMNGQRTQLSNEVSVVIAITPFEYRTTQLSLSGPNPADTGNIQLTWNAITGATGYTINQYHVDSGIMTPIQIIGPITFRNITLELNGTYFFNITATNGSANSAVSNNVSVNIAITAFALRTMTLSITGIVPPDSGDIPLSWNAVPYATRYFLYQDTSTITNIDSLTPTEIASIIPGQAPPTSRTVTVTVSGTYYFRIYATNGVDNTSLSNEVSVGITITPFNERVPVLSADPISTDGNVVLNWEQIPFATQYRIYRSTSTITTYVGMTPITSINKIGNLAMQTTYTDRNLQPGNYSYVLVASNGQVNSSMSNVVGVNVVNRPPPAPVLSIANDANPAIGFIKITWNQINIAEEYSVYRSTSSFTSKSGAELIKTLNSSFNYYNETMQNGTYYYRVIAKNGMGESELSNMVNITVAILPNAAPVLDNPADIEIEFGTTGRQIQWTATDSNITSTANYTIKRNGTEVATGTWVSGAKISYNIPGDLPVGYYSFVIEVNDGHGLTASDEVIVTVTENANTVVPSSFMQYLPYIGGGGAAVAIVAILAKMRKGGAPKMPKRSGGGPSPDVEDVSFDVNF